MELVKDLNSRLCGCVLCLGPFLFPCRSSLSIRCLYIHSLGGGCRCARRSISLDRHNTKQAPLLKSLDQVSIPVLRAFSACVIHNKPGIPGRAALIARLVTPENIGSESRPSTPRPASVHPFGDTSHDGTVLLAVGTHNQQHAGGPVANARATASC